MEIQLSCFPLCSLFSFSRLLPTIPLLFYVLFMLAGEEFVAAKFVQCCRGRERRRKQVSYFREKEELHVSE